MNRKIVLLTGATRGLGRYFLERLAADGFSVIGMDLPGENMLPPEVRSLMTGYFSFDLADLDGIPALVGRIMAAHGEIDILINNAGLKTFGLLDEIPADLFRKVLTVNFLAPVALICEVLPSMRKRNSGRIISISSNAAYEGYIKGAAYCSSKSALNLFTTSLAAELKGDVTINAVCPSTIGTSEVLSQHPEAAPGQYIAPAKVYNVVRNLITSRENGKLVPVIRLKEKIRYLVTGNITFLSWIFRPLK